MDYKQVLLASFAVVRQNAYNVHWNSKGNDFYSFHKLTEEVYEELDTLFDDLGEKIAMRGEVPLSTFSEYVTNSIVSELESKKYDVISAAKLLVDQFTRIIDFINDNNDESPMTQNLWDECLTFFDKYRWLLKSNI